MPATCLSAVAGAPTGEGWLEDLLAIMPARAADEEEEDDATDDDTDDDDEDDDDDLDDDVPDEA